MSVAMWGLALASFTASCTTSISAPDDTLGTYADAVINGDCARAATMMASPASFEQACETHPELFTAQAVAIRDAMARDTVDVQAELPVDRLRRVTLRRTGEGWRVHDAASVMDGGATPADALAALASAVDSPLVRQLLTVLSDDARAGFEAEIDAMITVLNDGGAREMDVYGDQTAVTVGDVTIRLVRENGTWRVSDFSQPSDFDYPYEEW